MNNKKIAFFLPSLVGGGAERVCVNLAMGIIQCGFEVDIVLARLTGDLLENVPSGVRIVDLHASRVLSALFPLVDYLRRERPAALISAPNHANLIAIWAKMLAGVNTAVVITTHNHLSIVIRQTPKMQEKLYPYFLRLFQGHAAHIVAVSAGVADDLARTAHIPRDRISVIYNPAVRPELDELASQPLVHPWFADKQPPVILAVGRLTPQKDYPTLLRAFALLRAQRPIRLVILGDGRQLAELDALSVQLGIATDVDFPGFDLNPYRYMARCSVFVLSSAWEGFSVVLAEALACGAQIVSTDCLSGPSEILDHGKYGRLVPVGDAKALAAEIENALILPLPAGLMRERAKEFTVDVAVKNYLRLLRLA
jgi:glycosyltransferase involved in cell wall biosynthesis